LCQERIAINTYVLRTGLALCEVIALNTFNILFSASLETLTFNTSRLTAVETINDICTCARKLRNIVDTDCKLLVTTMEIALGLALFHRLQFSLAAIRILQYFVLKFANMQQSIFIFHFDK
jgi:hypothetical protein